MNGLFEALLETGVDEMAWDDVGDDNVSREAAFVIFNFFQVLRVHSFLV